MRSDIDRARYASLLSAGESAEATMRALQTQEFELRQDWSRLRASKEAADRDGGSSQHLNDQIDMLKQRIDAIKAQIETEGARLRPRIRLAERLRDYVERRNKIGSQPRGVTIE
jgi:Ni/Co efflux regulator RcnB